jgi:hypothetical protein
MKKILLLYFPFFFSISAFCQVNPFTNAREDFTAPAVITELSGPDDFKSTLAGFPCTDNTFWAVYGSSVISLTLNGNTITNNGQVLTGSGGSLAFCNNLEGGAYSPTFYTNSGFTKAGYYNGTGWTACSAPPKAWVLNTGGNGNYLYYTAHDSITHLGIGIVRYNGSSYTEIYSLPDTGRAITVADLAVDVYGNAWFFTGVHSTLITDTLNVISPSGQMLKKYPFSYNTDNAYGCMLLNSIIYIALGSSNPDHPYTLVPVTIEGNTASAGDPIPMPAVNYSDLASCNAGSPLAVDEISVNQHFNIYPNPASGILHIDFDDNGDFPSSIRLINTTGEVIFSDSRIRENETIDMSALPSGIYYLMLDDYCQKIVRK